MSADGANWLTCPEREAEEQPDEALEGHWDRKSAAPWLTSERVPASMTIRMARLVGPSGKVYANDIQPRMLDLLRENLKKQKLTNVEPVLGEIDDPKLPPASLDLVLLVDVYHEFSEPQKMLRHIRESLKADGRLVLLEYRGEGSGGASQIRPEHKMTRGPR